MGDAVVSPTENDLLTTTTTPQKRLSVSGGVPIRPPPMLVQFKHPWAYRLAWGLVVAAHIGVVFAYNHEAYINGYILLGSKTEMAVQLLGLGASIRHEIGLALVWSNRVLMAWHVYGAARVILSSLHYRRLVFRFNWKKKSNKRDSMGERDSAAIMNGSKRKTVVGRVMQIVKPGWEFYRSTGARGKHFNTAFDIREAVEIVSQTVQAYTITCLITSNSVLHFVSLVLVLNCWSTPFLRFAFDTQEAKKRLLCLAVDAVFDFCCALAIPFLTFSLWEYQVATLDFFDDVWLIRSSTLLQYNLVNTWSGVFTTRLPALGLVLALETTKSLLHQHVVQQPSSRALNTTPAGRPTPDQPARPPSPVKDGPMVAAVPTKRASRVSKLVDLAFFVYGLVILILYTKAMAEPAIDHDPSSNCALQLRPWGRRKAQCAVLDLDCKRIGITGASSEIDTVLHQFDAGVLASVTIANCPSLEIPPSIQDLSRLLHLEIYNSTLVRWDASSALTKDSHPVLTGLFLVRVNSLQNGLPAGLLSTRFPPSLCVVQIVGGDLSVLAGSAADEAIIRTYWPASMFVVVVERTPLPALPTVILSKKITQTLSFASNSISSVPADVFFSVASSMSLFLNGNPITSLPGAAPTDSKVTSLGLPSIHVESTQILDLPVWIPARYNSSTALLYAQGTPLCAKAAGSLLPTFVDCETVSPATFFPLAAYEARRLART